MRQTLSFPTLAAAGALARPRADLMHDLLKTIAILAMVVDHVGEITLPHGSPGWLIAKTVGRLAWPIFTVLIGISLAEARKHGRDRPAAAKYTFRLLVFALIAQPITQLTLPFWSLNILFGLAEATGTVWLLTKIGDLRRRPPSVRRDATLAALFAGLLGLAVVSLFTDYAFFTAWIVTWVWWIAGTKVEMPMRYMIGAGLPLAFHLTVLNLGPLAPGLAALGGLIAVRLMDRPWLISHRIVPWWVWYAFYPLHLIVIKTIVG